VYVGTTRSAEGVNVWCTQNGGLLPTAGIEPAGQQLTGGIEPAGLLPTRGINILLLAGTIILVMFC
jgi:hypothetical protein